MSSVLGSDSTVSQMPMDHDVDDGLAFSLVARAGLAIFAAVILVHLFAGPIEPVGAFALHATLITAAYTAAFAFVSLLLQGARGHPLLRFVPAPALVPILSAVACLVGAAALGLMRLSGVLNVVIDVHDDANWALKLAPVWLVLTVVLFQSERSRLLETELRRLSASRAKIKEREADGRPSATDAGGDLSISIASGKTPRVLRVADVSHIAAVENYCEVHFTEAANRKPLLVRTTFATLIDQLPSDFARTHRSFAVNLSHVDAIVKHGRAFAATLSDGRTIIPVSRNSIDGVSARWRELLQARSMCAPPSGEKVAG